MSLMYNNINSDQVIYNGIYTTGYYNGNKVWGDESIYNPLNLPDYTIRCQYYQTKVPNNHKGTKTRVSVDPNIWDIKYNSGNWSGLFYQDYNLISVLGANTSSVLNMCNTFADCTELKSMALFDTSNVNNISFFINNGHSLSSLPLFNFSKVVEAKGSFKECSSLNYIPNFNFNSCTAASNIFYGCNNVSGGISSLFYSVIELNKNRSFYIKFNGCGTNTQQGIAERACIPEWAK